MANRKAPVSQAEVTRYLKAARDAGIAVSRFEIGRDGKVIVYSTTDATGETINDWDRP